VLSAGVQLSVGSNLREAQMRLDDDVEPSCSDEAAGTGEWRDRREYSGSRDVLCSRE